MILSLNSECRQLLEASAVQLLMVYSVNVSFVVTGIS